MSQYDNKVVLIFILNRLFFFQGSSSVVLSTYTLNFKKALSGSKCKELIVHAHPHNRKEVKKALAEGVCGLCLVRASYIQTMPSRCVHMVGRARDRFKVLSITSTKSPHDLLIFQRLHLLMSFRW